jgi:hypothetical protein
VSRDDVPVPEEVPRKRRVLEDESVTLDRFLAVWAARPDLTPSDRRRVEDERYRRKRLSPIVCLGVLVGREGMTPAQRQAFAEYREQIKATEVTEPADEGRNEGAMVVSLATKNGRIEEIARVGFSRENTRNPEASYHEQLDDVVARARKSVEVLNELTGDQGALL